MHVETLIGWLVAETRRDELIANADWMDVLDASLQAVLDVRLFDVEARHRLATQTRQDVISPTTCTSSKTYVSVTRHEFLFTPYSKSKARTVTLETPFSLHRTYHLNVVTVCVDSVATVALTP